MISEHSGRGAGKPGDEWRRTGRHGRIWRMNTWSFRQHSEVDPGGVFESVIEEARGFVPPKAGLGPRRPGHAVSALTGRVL